MTNLKKCKCGNIPDIIDSRLVFFVRCENHKPPFPVVYGENHRYIDHIDSDEDAEKAINKIDWDEAKRSAIENWNESEYAIKEL